MKAWLWSNELVDCGDSDHVVAQEAAQARHIIGGMFNPAMCIQQSYWWQVYINTIVEYTGGGHWNEAITNIHHFDAAFAR